MCFYRSFIIQQSTLIYFEEMEHECPHNIQTQKSRYPTEPDFTHLSDKGTSESPESFTESPDTHFSPRLGITVNESAKERVILLSNFIIFHSFM